jgi:hypothetical protein
VLVPVPVFLVIEAVAVGLLGNVDLLCSVDLLDNVEWLLILDMLDGVGAIFD